MRELGRRGLADDDRARGDQPLDDDRVGAWHPIGKNLRASRRHFAGHRREILDRHRETVKRTQSRAVSHRGFALLGARSGFFAIDRAERIELWIYLFDPGETRFEQCDGRQLAGADALGEKGCR